MQNTRDPRRTIKINGIPTPIPDGAIAWKYEDPIQTAGWVYDEDELHEIIMSDPGLIVHVPPAPEEE